MKGNGKGKGKEGKKNIVIREMKLEGEGEEGMRKNIGNLMKEIGVKVELKEVRRIGGKDSEEREKVWTMIRSKEEKKKIMEEKGKLIGRKEKIGDDLRR